MLVRAIRAKGANVVVEIHGEALFAPGAMVPNWKRRLTARVRAATITAAPTNKRPRWGHYGKPLKSTFKASTRTRMTKGGGFVYSAIGSTAPHAYYVDQGTGIFNGSGPYKAKILPPWTRGEGSLYEHTWRPTGPGGKTVAPVWIKGQKPKNFFDKGLKRGMASMRMRSFQVPGEGVSGIRAGMNTFPEGLANFKGNTAADGSFLASLDQWREWRDAAWARNDIGHRERPENRPSGYDAPKPPKQPKGPKQPKEPKEPKQPKPGEYPTLRDKQNAAVAAFKKQNPKIRIVSRINSGLIVIAPNGQTVRIPWSQLYNLL